MKRDKNNNIENTLQCLWILEEKIFSYLDHKSQHYFMKLCKCFYNRTDITYEWNIDFKYKGGANQMTTKKQIKTFLQRHQDGKHHFISQLMIRDFVYYVDQHIDDAMIRHLFGHGRGRLKKLILCGNKKLTNKTLRILETEQKEKNTTFSFGNKL